MSHVQNPCHCGKLNLPNGILEKCIGSLSAQTSNQVELVAPIIRSGFQLDSGLLTPPLLESEHRAPVLTIVIQQFMPEYVFGSCIVVTRL